jgi:hypothetical protein
MAEMIEGMLRGNPVSKTDDYGIGGINGMHHAEFGWDNTTVGMASSVFDNLLTQNGVRSNDPNYIGALEPIRAGRFIVKWLKVPTFFNDVAVKYLKFFLENAVKSVSGLSDNSIATAGSVTFGANQQEMTFPGNLKQNNQTVSLSTITCTGDGFGKLMRYWMYGITDPVTNIHHMYGKNLRFIRPNYSGTLMYIFMGPTCRPGDIEYACIWHEVWPTSGDGTQKWESSELGSDNTISDAQADFTGIFQDGPEVNILAKYIVAGAGLAGQSYFDQMLPAYMYKMFINKLDAGDEASIAGLEMSQYRKMENVDKNIYDADLVAKRKTTLANYGIDSTSLPSQQVAETAGTEKLDQTKVPNALISEIKGFTSTNYSDPIKAPQNTYQAWSVGTSGDTSKK